MVEFLDLYVTLGLLALLAEQANVPKMHWLKIMSSVFGLALKSLIKIVNDDSEILRVLSERSSFLISHQYYFMRGNLLNDHFFFVAAAARPLQLSTAMEVCSRYRMFAVGVRGASRPPLYITVESARWMEVWIVGRWSKGPAPSPWGGWAACPSGLLAG